MPPRILKSLNDATESADAFPTRERGMVGSSATARKALPGSVVGSEARARLSQPSGVDLFPGVPLSTKSWASKCERVGAGIPTP